MVRKGSPVRVRQRALEKPAGNSGFFNVNAGLARLEDAGILREVTGRRRGRVFVYDAYLALLQAEQ